MKINLYFVASLEYYLGPTDSEKRTSAAFYPGQGGSAKAL